MAFFLCGVFFVNVAYAQKLNIVSREGAIKIVVDGLKAMDVDVSSYEAEAKIFTKPALPSIRLTKEQEKALMSTLENKTYWVVKVVLHRDIDDLNRRKSTKYYPIFIDAMTGEKINPY
jgi:hypothetical protein